MLTVLADPTSLRIVEGSHVLATHPRSYDKGAQIEIKQHIQDLVEHKRKGRRHRATDRLVQAAPSSRELLVCAAERGDNIGAITSALINLLDRFGASELEASILVALQRDVPHHNAVRQILACRRDQRSPHVQARDKPAKTTALDIYDRIGKKDKGDGEP